MREFCKCGCGKRIVPKRTHKYGAGGTFLQGHHTKWYIKKGKPPPHSYTPNESEIPSGICECGCGKKTDIARVTDRKRRHFKGHPLPYCHSHSKRKYGKDNPSWKGGTYMRRGYVMQHAPEHPKADSKGYVPQHRLVAEKKLGRSLMENERVHHINGIKDDNDPKNLVVLTNNKHSELHGSTKGEAA